MDITSLIPNARNTIQSYGGGGFRVAGVHYHGSVLVLPSRVVPWTVCRLAELTRDSFADVVAETPRVDILLVGCGPRPADDPRRIAKDLIGTGITTEVMDTGAACRTFNVLLAEDRRVAAALIAV